MPAKVKSLAHGAGFSADVNTRTPGGATFAGHSTGHSIQSITNGGDWDVVVLQGQSQRSSFGSGYVNHYIVPETVILGNAIKATNPCIMPLFYQTWGKRDGDSQNCGNHELFCSYEGIQDQLTQSYNTYVRQPAGQGGSGGGGVEDVQQQELTVCRGRVARLVQRLVLGGVCDV